MKKAASLFLVVTCLAAFVPSSAQEGSGTIQYNVKFRTDYGLVDVCEHVPGALAEEQWLSKTGDPYTKIAVTKGRVPQLRFGLRARILDPARTPGVVDKEEGREPAIYCASEYQHVGTREEDESGDFFRVLEGRIFPQKCAQTGERHG